MIFDLVTYHVYKMKNTVKNSHTNSRKRLVPRKKPVSKKTNRCIVMIIMVKFIKWIKKKEKMRKYTLSKPKA